VNVRDLPPIPKNITPHRNDQFTMNCTHPVTVNNRIDELEISTIHLNGPQIGVDDRDVVDRDLGCVVCTNNPRLWQVSG